MKVPRTAKLMKHSIRVISALNYNPINTILTSATWSSTTCPGGQNSDVFIRCGY